MNKGFYTVLGTLLDENLNFSAKSMANQTEAGVSGLLVMGSMGQMTYLKNSIYPEVAKVSVEAAKGRVPVLVGVTDLSIHRVMDRVAALEGVDGIVSTIPYYGAVSQDNIYDFYNEIANQSGRATYLYDLVVVTKTATAPAAVKRLWKKSLIKGIKSGNMVTAGKELDAILGLRDLYISTGCLMAAFSHSMNLLGCEGWFATDYNKDISDENKERVTTTMKALGEI